MSVLKRCTKNTLSAVKKSGFAVAVFLRIEFADINLLQRIDTDIHLRTNAHINWMNSVISYQAYLFFYIFTK